jgi:hypothetical protein
MRIPAELPLPESVAQHDRKRRAVTVVGWSERPTERCARPEHVEEVAGHRAIRDRDGFVSLQTRDSWGRVHMARTAWRSDIMAPP